MPHDPFYWSAKWRSVRSEYLAAHPTCCVRGCGEAATHVDHCKPRSRGGASYAWSNLQAMCHPHHSAKTAARDGGFGNRRGGLIRGCDAAGNPVDPLHSWNLTT